MCSPAFCRSPGDSSLRYFAPLGLMRRFVEMPLQAGISPRVGRNDERRGLTVPLLSPSSPPSSEPSRRRKERRRQRSRFLPTMAKTSVRRARTPHRGGAHNARFTPQGEAFLFSRLPCARGGGLPKARRKGCRARTSPDLTTLPPRFARHPPLHREGKGRECSLCSAPSRIGLPQKDAVFLWDFRREGEG